MKTCRRCNILKPLDSYYKHKLMFDGYLNICKECVKDRVAVHRADNLDKIKEYDRNRPNRKERNEKHKLKLNRMKLENPGRWEKQLRYKREYSKKTRKKNYATVLLKRQIEKGIVLKPNYCADCGGYFENKSDIHGHHEDYNMPLSVVWLCVPCHVNIHKLKDEVRRENAKRIRKMD